MVAWGRAVFLRPARSGAQAQTRRILRARRIRGGSDTPPAFARPVVTSEEVAPPGHAWRRRSFRRELRLVAVAGTDSLWNGTRRETTQTYRGPRTLQLRQRTEGRHQLESCQPIRMFRLHMSFPKPATRAPIPIRQTLILLSPLPQDPRRDSSTSCPAWPPRPGMQ